MQSEALGYTSTFIRYERRGARVVPVRVTKSWVEPPELRAAPGKQKVLKPAQAGRSFHATRVTELKMRDVRGGREESPEPWTSWDRQESRERLLGLVTKYKLPEGGEPVLVPVGAGLATLEMGNPLEWTRAQHEQPMDAEPETREWWMRREWAESRGYWDDDAEAA